MKNTDILGCMQLAIQALADARLLWHTNKSHRAAACRAYYSAFYATQVVLETKAINPASHYAQISLFGEHFIKPGILPKELGKALGSLFTLRLGGDYDVAYSMSD